MCTALVEVHSIRCLCTYLVAELVNCKREGIGALDFDIDTDSISESSSKVEGTKHVFDLSEFFGAPCVSAGGGYLRNKRASVTAPVHLAQGHVQNNDCAIIRIAAMLLMMKRGTFQIKCATGDAMAFSSISSLARGGRDASPCSDRGRELVDLMSRGCHTRHPECDP